MNRIEKVRKYVDEMLLKIPDPEYRRCGYMHLYGVSQACTLIAMKRKENAELAAIAGMLHDIYSYTTMDTRDHAHKGSVMAREILESFSAFEPQEMDLICNAIYHHSSKGKTHDSFSEVLIDGDVMQHCFYNPLFEVAEKEKARYEKLKAEFEI